MRLLHVVPTYLPATRYGGPIWSVHNLCRALVAKGHQVEVFTTNVDGPGDSDVPLGRAVEIDGVRVWYFPSRHLRRLYWSPPMERALRERVEQFEIVHLHSIYLWPTLAAARAARSAAVPYIISPRGMLVKDLVQRKSRLVKSAWLNLFERRNLEQAAAVHVTSEIEATEALKFGFCLPKMVTIPNGVEVEDRERRIEDRELPDLAAENYFLFIGRVNWKKGLDRLIPAMRHVAGAKLVIAGNDEENYRPALEKFAQDCGVASRVAFVGPVRGQAKAGLLENAIALVLPSYSENFGNVVLEAMAAGTPVVVTPEVGAAEIVREARGGVVVDGDPDKLGPALARLLADPDLCREMGERGQRLVLAKYSWEAVAQQMEDAYRQILGGKR